MRLVEGLPGRVVEKGFCGIWMAQTGMFIRALVPGDAWWNKIPFEMGWLNA